jgi:hypothetical protein
MELKKALPQAQRRCFGSSMREATAEAMDHLDIYLRAFVQKKNLRACI